MTNAYFDLFFFGVFPYISLAVFLVMVIYRYRTREFTYSSLSSQLLENQHHFHGMVPFHYGILAVLTGHLVAFLLPQQLLLWNLKPLRLYVLEISTFVCALLSLFGLLNLLVRRGVSPALRKVTLLSDWILFGMLLVQIALGIQIAIFHPWGSSWFAASLTPYLWSLVALSPDLAFVVPMPLLVKAHIVGAFILIAYFPFTRLVHVLVAPVPYLWRKPQVVRWYGSPSNLARGGRLP
ncbi:MAG TPA: respiratory nitrate reductase subunit gamma [Elusimicrobia bacterium]|nr:MAG: respiratory nitrate reductase subunit gamma [Elusimicrobia bacterium GWA2_66_18]OGR72747.1 MAG: respiratory nitrate reductase subunit gamma [Elusimicrobia bacterium GWC2_65_9]HAZ08731.1 respiratory nitrate reductase subunit gamma [Elusimicrobiota bacterium]